ncbi:hypothetical protein VNO77_20356 [Canavalia gladiata]|uniref:Uncharacterized protein n=1 Tax=Canavalia gladiata TaxID=3824 RepID=A0AAN9LP29_CANGL
MVEILWWLKTEVVHPVLSITLGKSRVLTWPYPNHFQTMLCVMLISNNINSWSFLSSHFPNLLSSIPLKHNFFDCVCGRNMASMTPLQTIIPKNTPNIPARATVSNIRLSFAGSSSIGAPCNRVHKKNNNRSSTIVVSAVGDVSSDSTTYLVAGAIAVALVGTAFPIFFARKDTCPECDGAGFVRRGDAALRANAARKDQTQIVCARCNGLGKLNQIDK